MCSTVGVVVEVHVVVALLYTIAVRGRVLSLPVMVQFFSPLVLSALNTNVGTELVISIGVGGFDFKLNSPLLLHSQGSVRVSEPFTYIVVLTG